LSKCVSKIKQERTLVQVKCDKMVTSAMPSSNHLKSEIGKNSMKFFSHSQLQHTLCDHINLLSLRHTAYPLRRKSHSIHQVGYL